MVKHNKKINDDDNLKMEEVIQQKPGPNLIFLCTETHKTQIIGYTS
jgi:hypothetical protein